MEDIHLERSLVISPCGVVSQSGEIRYPTSVARCLKSSGIRGRRRPASGMSQPGELVHTAAERGGVLPHPTRGCSSPPPPSTLASPNPVLLTSSGDWLAPVAAFDQ